jgi:hypothetical protein
MSGPKTRGQAINAMCRGCIYDDLAAGTWREQVAACVSGACPLHAFRPMPRNVNSAEDLAELRGRLEATNRRRSA